MIAARWFVCLGVVVLSGCAGIGHQPVQPQTLVLLQALSVAEGKARVFLQNGVAVAAINEFLPHCALEISHLEGPPRTISPARYPIKRIQFTFTPVVFGAPARQVAQGTPDDGPSDIFEGYHYWLVDTQGIGLRRMTCYGMRAEPGRVRPPTDAEIDQVLGELGRLER